MNRAGVVLNELSKINTNVKTEFLDTLDLLLEAHEGAYHTCFGYTQFGEWIEDTPQIDMSKRTALYYVNIGKKVQTLGIPREELLRANISQLKKIFELDPAEHAPQMKMLVEKAENFSVKETEEAVNQLHGEKGRNPSQYLTLKLDPEVKEMQEQAVELARRLHGSTVDQDTGEIRDISVSKAHEYIYSSFLLDVNNHPEDRAA